MLSLGASWHDAAVWPFRENTPPPPPTTFLLREVVKLGLLVGGLLALAYFFSRGGNFIRVEPPAATLADTHLGGNQGAALCGTVSLGARPLPIDMVYSEDLRRWIEPAADRFARLCPNIQVRLTALPDIEAADAILAGKVQPTIWAATDDLSLRYLEDRWSQRGDALPFVRAEQQELVHSPLVLLMWQDRLRLLSAVLRNQASTEGRWTRSLCAGIPREADLAGVPQESLLPGTWADFSASLLAVPPPPPPPRGKAGRQARAIAPIRPVGDEPLPTLQEVEQWGRVKIGHTSPTRDSAGLAALFLLAYDYLQPPPALAAAAPPAPLPASTAPDGGVAASVLAGTGQTAPEFESAFDAQRIALRRWLRRCEGGLDLPPPSARQLTASLFNVGPSLYDGVITYEHLALPYLDRVDAHAAALGRLVLLYPEPTLVARHPAVVFHGSADLRAAAERWLRFLRSKLMQEAAIDAGFRPVGSEVSLRSYESVNNRFLSLRRYGVVVQPVLREAPRIRGKTAQSLIELWGEVTGRN